MQLEIIFCQLSSSTRHQYGPKNRCREMQWTTIPSCYFSHSTVPTNLSKLHFKNKEGKECKFVSIHALKAYVIRQVQSWSIYTVILNQKYSHSLLSLTDILICYVSQISLSMTSAEYPTLVPILLLLISVRFEVKILEMMRIKVGLWMWGHAQNDIILPFKVCVRAILWTLCP